LVNKYSISRVIIDENTTLSDLMQYNPSQEIQNTFYKDSNYGIGWGCSGCGHDDYILVIPNPNRCTKMEITISQLLPHESMGSLATRIGNEAENDLYTFFSLQDAWHIDSEGHSLYAEGEWKYETEQVLFENLTYVNNDFSVATNLDYLYIIFEGYTYSQYDYNKPYIKYLRLY
jgi:hypothetical protein